MSRLKRILWPIGAGLGGMSLLMAVYFGIVSGAESPRHAVELFWQDRWIVIPIIVGFGIQSALYVILKKRLFIPLAYTRASGALTGTGGATSTLAMVACCAHHVTDALPVLGLTAAATFFAEYQVPFMVAGLATNVIGIGVMLFILLQERRNVMRTMASDLEPVSLRA